MSLKRSYYIATNIILAIIAILITLGCASSNNIHIQSQVNFSSNHEKLNQIKRIAIFDFSGPPQTQIQNIHFITITRDINGGKLLAAQIRDAMIYSGLYEIIERNKINHVLNEQSLYMSGIIDDKSAIDIGKILGVDAIIIGEVFTYDTGSRFYTGCWSFDAAIRSIDVKTGSVLWSYTISRGYLHNNNESLQVVEISKQEAQNIVAQIISKSKK